MKTIIRTNAAGDVVTVYTDSVVDGERKTTMYSVGEGGYIYAEDRETHDEYQACDGLYRRGQTLKISRGESLSQLIRREIRRAAAWARAENRY